MASDYLLQIDGIKGESNDQKHKDAIEIESFSWGVSNPSTGHGAGGGAGKASFQDIHFTSRASKASPSLFLACAAGMHFKKATLFVGRQEAKSSVDYYEVTLDDLQVTSYSAGGAGGTSGEGGDPTPTDQFSLNFSKIEFSYKSQNEKGELEAPVTGGWNLSKNSKI